MPKTSDVTRFRSTTTWSTGEVFEVLANRFSTRALSPSFDGMRRFRVEVASPVPKARETATAGGVLDESGGLGVP